MVAKPGAAVTAVLVVLWTILLIHVSTRSFLLSSHNFIAPTRQCVRKNVYCDGSVPFSYLMESLPSIARSWTPCRDLVLDGNPAHGGVDGDAFEVEVCVRSGEVYVTVIHYRQHECLVPGAADLVEMGLLESDVARDYIEVLLAGPERRLQRMEYVPQTDARAHEDTFSCLYELRVPVRVSGDYRIQLLGIHTNITLRDHEPYRNYILWDDVYPLTLDPVELDAAPRAQVGDALHDPGIWTVSKGVDGARNDYNFGPSVWAEERNVHAYRCPLNGTLTHRWTRSQDKIGHDDHQQLSAGPANLSTGVVVNGEDAMSCIRRLSPQYDKPRPKVVLFGDSMMRQTFDAFAIALGMKNVKAVKEFKSLMDSQDWGGADFGVDVCFQWSARYNEGRERCKGPRTNDAALPISV